MKFRWKMGRKLSVPAAVVSVSMGLVFSGTLPAFAKDPWPSDPTSVTYAAKYGTLYPVSVTESSQVTDPENATSGGSITLTYSEGGTAPYILLDYGKDVGGHVKFDVTSVDGSPTMNIAYSESLTYADSGDGRAYMENSLTPSRSVDYELSGAESVEDTLLQGGLRYQRISLTTPGTSVTISGISLDATLSASSYDVDDTGYFSSSSSTLNKIWQIGAYAVDGNRVEADTMPSPWTLTSEGVTIIPSNPAIYQGFGLNDTGTTTTFKFRVEKGGVSWVVYHSFSSTIKFTLHASDDEDSPNTLTGSAGGSFSDTLRADFDTVDLTDYSLSLEPDGTTWHTVTTTAVPITDSGDKSITVNLDGTDIATVYPANVIAASSLASAIPDYLALGSSGLFNEEGHTATVKNFSVTGTDLTSFSSVSYSADLTDEDTEVLKDFAVGDNEVPIITDGMKRDRYAFSGDALVAGPTAYYTTGNGEPMEGLLNLLGQYIDSDGQLASVIPLKLTLDSTDRDAGPTNPWFSLGYSLYYLDILYDYVMYTGDEDLASSLWSQVESEVSYLSSQQDATTHLLVTDDISGFNWHPQYDATYAGSATDFNLDYVKAMEHASSLASLLGKSTEATTYAAAAETVKDAINDNLYNDAGYYEISDARTGYVAQDANSKAILYGVADSEQTSAIWSTMNSELSNDYGHLAFDQSYFDTYNSGSTVVSPYSSNWEILARFEEGDTDTALAYIQKLWGRMVDEGDYYSGATWESLDGDTGYPVDGDISLAHGWASGPTSALSKYVLGVTPVTPGFATWMIRPQTGSLSWAAGRVPTPYGPITCKWVKFNSGNSLKLHIVVPDGTSGTIALPALSQNGKAKINGTWVSADSTSTLGDQDYLYFNNIEAGTYDIEVKGSNILMMIPAILAASQNK